MLADDASTIKSKVLENFDRCRTLLSKLPPMEGSVKYKRTWSIETALEQHHSLMRQHELQSSIGKNHVSVRKAQSDFARIEAAAAAAECRELLASPNVDSAAAAESTKRALEASAKLRLALHAYEMEEQVSVSKTRRMEEEIEKSNKEMVLLREAIDDVSNGGGPIVAGMPASAANRDEKKERKYFYCSDCHVGGHGQRFCGYLLKRPNWRVYPSEKWFENKNGQISHCPLGRRGVDFADETYFSRISMHIKGRIWLEDKRKLYEFVPELMPYTYVILDQQWVGDPPPPEPEDAEPLPWFVKETDRNFGTSVVCCSKPEECMGLAKTNGCYVVQKHIAKPLNYHKGEKLHIKFYNLLYGLEDGRTWRLYTYHGGYLCLSPKKWDATDLSKEGQVTIIRTKRINDWEHWERAYPLCKQAIATCVKRAVEEGKLEGRIKKQFEIISSDFVINENFEVFLLEFNTGPVLKDPEDSPNEHDQGMIEGALHIVEPYEGGNPDKWDFAIECRGEPLKPEDTGIDAL